MQHLVLLRLAGANVVVGNPDVVMAWRPEWNRGGRRRVDRQGRWAGNARERDEDVLADRLGRHEDLIDDAVEALALGGCTDPHRGEDIPQDARPKDLTKLLAVDEEEHERSVEHPGDVGPDARRDRRS